MSVFSGFKVKVVRHIAKGGGLWKTQCADDRAQNTSEGSTSETGFARSQTEHAIDFADATREIGRLGGLSVYLTQII